MNHGPAAATMMAAVVATTAASGGSLLPPWNDPRDVALPEWARSVVPKNDDAGRPGDMRLFVEPNRNSAPRGVTSSGVSLPFFGVKRGPGCSGRWWLVAPLAWTCSDDAVLSRDPPRVPASALASDPALLTYYFTKGDGAGAYVSLESAVEGAPDRDLEGGWGVLIVDEHDAGGTRWGRTSHGMWIAMSDLIAARAATFHGEALTDGRLDFAWIVADRALVWPSPVAKGKPSGSRERFRRVDVLERSGAMIRIGDGAWVLAADLAQPSIAAPPEELARPRARWIDVELATETLVAYEGPTPLYATLVSTGRGPAGSGSETPTGVHRIWVKIAASDMSNNDRGDLEAHYSLEDVPYVQFFNGSVALHGTYWHGDFGHIRSHGCVNLSIPDAKWLFDFTLPRLPAGWAATYPTPLDDATVVRVR
jgi:hypothetical protein